MRLQEIRLRLVKAGASDGTITDSGAIRLVTFRDPDGMEGEVARWTDSKRVLGLINESRRFGQINNLHSDDVKTIIPPTVTMRAVSAPTALLS